jgi:hypothetical protein
MQTIELDIPIKMANSLKYSTVGPRYMWSFYLRFCICEIENWHF